MNILIGLILLAAASAMPAHAQFLSTPFTVPCAPAAVVLKAPDKLGEAMQWERETVGGNTARFYLNPDTGSWTFTLTKDGVTCFLSAGWGDQKSEPPAPEPEPEPPKGAGPLYGA